MEYYIGWENKKWTMWFNTEKRSWYFRLIKDLLWLLFIKNKRVSKYSLRTEDYYTEYRINISLNK